jgi:PAS domain S-box-containing protein
MKDPKVLDSALEGIVLPTGTFSGENGNNILSVPEQLSLVVNALPAMITYIDANRNIRFINKAVEKTFGISSEMVVGKHLSKLLSESGYDTIQEYVGRALNGEKIQYETEVPLPIGTRYIEATYTPDFGIDGKVKGYIALVNDITERKKIEAELHRKSHELEDYIENASIGLHWVDANGIIIWANKAEMKMLGYSPDEYIGHPIAEFHTDKKKIDDILNRLGTKETLQQYEAFLKCKDGSVKTVLINSNVLWENGRFVHTRCFTLDITDQKADRIALEESRKSYQQLIQSLPAAIYTTDEHGVITMYNEAAVQLWGRRPVVGKDLWCGSFKIFERDGKTEIPLHECPMAVALKEKRKVIVSDPFIVETPGGVRKWFLPHPKPVFDSKGNMTGAVNMLFDVTDQKMAEEQSAKLAAIVQSSDDAIISKGLDSVVTSWNPAAEKMFGYTAAEMIGQPILRIIPEDRLNEEPLIIKRIKAGDSIEHFETKRKAKDGSLVDISLTISPIKDALGNIIGISKIARDITLQKNLQVKLEQREEQSAKLAAIVQSSDDAIVSETFDGIVTSWNPAAEKMFGYSAGEMMGQPISNIIPGDRVEEKPLILERIKKGLSIEHHETLRKTKDGRLIDVSLTISPVKDSKGNVIGVSKISRDITVQKKMIEEIREKEEKLRMAIESAHLGTWEYNPVTFKMICSKESQKICGIPQHLEPDFELILQHIYPDDRDKFIEQIKKAIKSVDEGIFDLIIRINRYSDDKLRWVSVKGKVFFDQNYWAQRLIGTMMDVTEEKEREEKLSESVELFQTMADNLPAMIWMSGTDKFNDYFNRTWLEFTGRQPEEEANEGWLDNVHPDDVQRCIDNYNESYRQQKGMYTEYRLKRHDGQYRWIADNSVPRYNPAGDFVGFISACMDIDDQKRFREKIRDSELLFKTISNASPTALWMTDADGQNVFVNDTWINWTGKSFDQQLEEGWLSSVVEEDKELAHNEYKHCSRLMKYYKAEFRFRKSDGEIRWGLTEGYPYFDSNGGFAGYAGSVTDITEIKKLEQRKDDFIKMASHELKTPITSINGYVQLLLNIYNEMDAEKLISTKTTVKSSLQTISKQVSKLARLVSELLDLSRIETGQLELNKQEFDLAELVEDVAQEARNTTSRHAVIVHNDFSGSFFGDRDRIAQVILNLLTNAIKYSPDSDNVEVFLLGNQKEAVVKVKDMGIGIDKKDHPRIFERFYRVEGKSEQTYPGFGIGLFIASEIVQRHGGTISLESEKGKGSTFTVRLPLKS